MQARLNARAAAPEAMNALSRLHAYVRNCGLEHKYAAENDSLTGSSVEIRDER
jgi:hypothetical protein